MMEARYGAGNALAGTFEGGRSATYGADGVNPASWADGAGGCGGEYA